jgi:small GTP-binding protein
MADDFNYDVFLSHSSKDKAVVRPLAERLRADGLRVWFDEWELHPGDNLPSKIEEGLEQSRVLVLCMSAHAFGSDWAQLEAGTLRFRDPLNNDRRFIPLRLDDAHIKGSLAQFIYINRLLDDREQEYAKLLDACRPPATPKAVRKKTARKQIAEKAIKLDYESRIYAYAFDPDGKRALTAAEDKTVRLWDVETGQCLRVLEGHDTDVQSVAWCADQRRALSGDRSGGIQVWDLSEFVTEARASEASTLTLSSAPEQAQYTNAKVLLVGDTGVGKSGLAERLVNKQFVPTKSSHARRAHILESKVVQEPGGVSLHQETVLWDLAGQPAYRLVHQLSLEDAALACVLFDCRNETNPFEGAAYWSQVLDQARTNTKLKKLLVASRIDVGGLPASKERIETFVGENGFAQFISTSAYTGDGCDDLLEAICQGIAWGELPKVTTTKTLAALRDYVARLKAENSGIDAKDKSNVAPTGLFTIAALHEGFCSYFGEKIPLLEFIAHLERLEATDAVHLLVFRTTGAEPRPETLALLDPTRVDAYASALLVAAKDEPDGPGHLLESRVRDGVFTLDREERIADRESERHVLWYVLENLLSRDLALREQIKGEDYVVFPSQCTAELRFPGVAAFGVAFGFSGPVRSIYATLIAQLAHYEGFKKREFFQDAEPTALKRADAAWYACATTGTVRASLMCCSIMKLRRPSGRDS